MVIARGSAERQKQNQRQKQKQKQKGDAGNRSGGKTKVLETRSVNEEGLTM
jgi:hypothetical protein